MLVQKPRMGFLPEHPVPSNRGFFSAAPSHEKNLRYVCARAGLRWLSRGPYDDPRALGLGRRLALLFLPARPISDLLIASVWFRMWSVGPATLNGSRLLSEPSTLEPFRSKAPLAQNRQFYAPLEGIARQSGEKSSRLTSLAPMRSRRKQSGCGRQTPRHDIPYLTCSRCCAHPTAAFSGFVSASNDGVPRLVSG